MRVIVQLVARLNIDSRRAPLDLDTRVMAHFLLLLRHLRLPAKFVPQYRLHFLLLIR